MENNQYFLKVSSEPSQTISPDSRALVTQDDLQTFPDINKFVEDLLKSLQEKERIITFKTAEIESLKNLLVHYRADQNALEFSVKIKQLTKNFEAEKKSLQDSHRKSLDEKSHEVLELKRELETLVQEKKSLVHMNEALQQEFQKLRADLATTGEKLRALEAETQNIQGLLQEAEAENQITKAKLTEYEQIGFRTSEKIHEVQARTNQIRRESHDILELNRKSLKGLEESNLILYALETAAEEMQLDEEMRRLDKISKKLESFSSEILGKVGLKRAQTAGIKYPKSFSPRTRDDSDYEIRARKARPKHLHKVMSFAFENSSEESFNGLHTIHESAKEKPISSGVKKRMVLRNCLSEGSAEVPDKEKRMRVRAKSFDSQATLEDGGDKEEGVIKDLRVKIEGLIEKCEAVCRQQEAESPGIYRSETESKSLEEINRKLRNMKDLFLKYCETLDKFYHQKILKTLELTNNLSDISAKLKTFLQEKATFERNLNDILNLIDRKESNKFPNSQSSNYEGYLARLRRVIENSIDDQHTLKSQNFDINDVVKEKKRLESENNHLKREMQGLSTRVSLLQKKSEGLSKEINEERASHSEVKSAERKKEVKCEGLDEIVNEIEENDQKSLRNLPSGHIHRELAAKKESLKDLINNFRKAKEAIHSFSAQMKDIPSI